jgi:hypothetical protein
MTLCTLNVWYVKYEIAESRLNVKVVDVNSVIDDYKLLLNYRYEQGKLTNEEMVRLTAEFITSLDAALKGEGGIILISQSVLTGGEDVTDKIKQRLNR